MKTIIAGLLAVTLMAGNGAKSAESGNMGTEDIRHALKITTSGNGFPLRDYPEAHTSEITRIWSGTIPVQIKGMEKARGAIETIKAKTGIKLEIVPDIPPITHGLIFSKNTSPIAPFDRKAPEKYQGNTSAAPNTPCWPWNFFDAQGNISTLLYINMGNAKFDADGLDEKLYIHEIAHALGMFNHFDQFGETDTFGPLAWRVLKTLYANPPGTPVNAATISP